MLSFKRVATSVFHPRRTAFPLALVVMLTLVGCDRASVKWSEEVRLADGQVIVAARTAQGKTYTELGGTGGWRDPVAMSISISKAQDGFTSPPAWRDNYVPVLLDHNTETNTWSIVATFYYCEVWYALDRPIPPYIEYQSVDGAAWRRVPLEERLVDLETNLLTGPRTKGEPGIVTLKEKQHRQRGAGRNYRHIVRKWGIEEGNNCAPQQVNESNAAP